MEKLKKPFLFFLALLLMMWLIGFTTHVFADDEDTEIQTSTEVTDKAEANAGNDDSQTEDSKISDDSESIVTENANSSESNEMDKMSQTDSTEELENTEELYAMDSDTNENEISTIAEKHNLFIDPNGGTYGGNSGVTTVNSEYGASYELNEIPVRDGYTFAGWKSENANIISGNAGEGICGHTNSKLDSDGTPYTNFSNTFTNNLEFSQYPSIYFYYYPYTNGHKYSVQYDMRIHSIDNLYYFMMRNAMCDNDWTPPASVMIDCVNPTESFNKWKHYTMTTPYPITGDTWYIDNKYANPIRPNVEFYARLEGGQTGTYDFDIRNIVVYDETDQKYLPSISDNAKAGTTVEMGDSDATVTAVWEPNTYKVSYDINGGTRTIEDQSFTYGNTSGSIISATKPTKKGYTFAGWRWDDPNDESNFRLFDPGDKIPSDLQDFTLHAMWVANGYHVTFEGNGADSGIMSDEAFTYDDNAKSLTANSFTREGYRFAGWNTKADGSGQSYTDTQAVKNLSEGGETILVNTNSLQFNQTKNSANSDVLNSIIINNPVKDLNSLTSGIAYSTTITKEPYYVSDGVYSQPLEAFTSDFRTFFADKKMNISFRAKSDTPMEINNVGFESASDQKTISLNNQWNTYSITAKMYSSIDIHALTFYNAQQLGTYYVGDLNVTMGGEVKLYAQWEPVTYTNSIHHWAMGLEHAEGNNARKDAFQLNKTLFTKKYGEQFTYTANDATSIPNGYALPEVCGTTSYEGSWRTYSIGTSFMQPSKSTFMEFYYWPITYSINYNLNGGPLTKPNPSTYNVLYGVDFTNEPTKNGYRFLGWYIGDQKVTGINVGANASFSSAEDLYTKLKTRTTGNQTVTAKWEKLTDLKVNTVVSGNLGSRDKEFSFTTQFPSSMYNKNLSVEKSDGTTGTIAIDDSGVAPFTLKHGESITFKDLTAEQANAVKILPDLGIKEQNYSSEGYSTVYSVSSEPDGTLVVSYRNTKRSAVPTGNHIGTGIIATVLIGIVGLLFMLRKKRK